METDRILKSIQNRCSELKIKFNSKGYVDNFEDNLIELVSNWTDIKKEFENGDGSELVSIDNRPPKFKSIFSSAALCVNNFAIIKKIISQSGDISLLDFNGFYSSNFETKLTTGLRGHSPNLDFTAENDLVFIGIESKFTEILTPKLPNEKRYGKSYGNLEPYYKSKKVDFLNGFKESVIKYYIDYADKMHLDASQLIKHTLGLINKSNFQKKPILLYIYWVPVNWSDFDVYKIHKDEIDIFCTKLSPYIDFVPMFR